MTTAPGEIGRRDRAYYTLDAGIVGELGEHFELRLQGSNLTD